MSVANRCNVTWLPTFPQVGGGIPSPRSTAAAFAGSGISPRVTFLLLTCRNAEVPIGRHGPRLLALRGLRVRLRGRGSRLLDQGLRPCRQARRDREPEVPAAEDIRVHRAEAPLRARVRHGLGTEAGARDADVRPGVGQLHLRRRDRGHGHRARHGDQADDHPDAQHEPGERGQPPQRGRHVLRA